MVCVPLCARAYARPGEHFTDTPTFGVSLGYRLIYVLLTMLGPVESVSTGLSNDICNGLSPVEALSNLGHTTTT